MANARQMALNIRANQLKVETDFHDGLKYWDRIFDTLQYISLIFLVLGLINQSWVFISIFLGISAIMVGIYVYTKQKLKEHRPTCMQLERGRRAKRKA